MKAKKISKTGSQSSIAIHSLRARLEILSSSCELDEISIQNTASSLLRQIYRYLEHTTSTSHRGLLEEFVLKPLLASAKEYPAVSSSFACIEAILDEVQTYDNNRTLLVSTHIWEHWLMGLLDIIHKSPESVSFRAWSAVKACFDCLKTRKTVRMRIIVSAIDAGFEGLKSSLAEVREAAAGALVSARHVLACSCFSNRRQVEASKSDLLGLIDIVLRRHALYDESLLVRATATKSFDNIDVSQHGNSIGSEEHQPLRAEAGAASRHVVDKTDDVHLIRTISKEEEQFNLKDLPVGQVGETNSASNPAHLTGNPPTEHFDDSAVSSPRSSNGSIHGISEGEKSHGLFEVLEEQCIFSDTNSVTELSGAAIEKEVTEFLRGSLPANVDNDRFATILQSHAPPSESLGQSNEDVLFDGGNAIHLLKARQADSDLLLEALNFSYGDKVDRCLNMTMEDKESILNTVLDLFAEREYDKQIKDAENLLEHGAIGIPSLDDLKTGRISTRTKTLEDGVHRKVAESVQRFCNNMLPILSDLLDDSEEISTLMAECQKFKARS